MCPSGYNYILVTPVVKMLVFFYCVNFTLSYVDVLSFSSSIKNWAAVDKGFDLVSVDIMYNEVWSISRGKCTFYSILVIFSPCLSILRKSEVD